MPTWSCPKKVTSAIVEITCPLTHPNNSPWDQHGHLKKYHAENALITDQAVAALIQVTGGNFQLLHRLLAQVGRILEINGLGVVTREAVEVAREVLVIGAA